MTNNHSQLLQFSVRPTLHNNPHVYINYIFTVLAWAISRTPKRGQSAANVLYLCLILLLWNFFVVTKWKGWRETVLPRAGVVVGVTNPSGRFGELAISLSWSDRVPFGITGMCGVDGPSPIGFFTANSLLRSTSYVTCHIVILMNLWNYKLFFIKTLECATAEVAILHVSKWVIPCQIIQLTSINTWLHSIITL